jgi:hypothetical protein
VTGVVAKMMQANPAISVWPHILKLQLLLAADSEGIHPQGNPPTYSNALGESALRTKSGAGLVNARKAVEYAIANNTQVYIWEPYPYSSIHIINLGYLSKGKTVRFVVVTPKNT